MHGAQCIYQREGTWQGQSPKWLNKEEYSEPLSPDIVEYHEVWGGLSKFTSEKKDSCITERNV